MKKKARIIGSISALAISMAMLTGGVLAASQVSLDVSSSVSFEASGVYVKVNGQIQKGASTDSLADAVDTTGTDYKYIGYSYDAVTEQTETGQTATTYDDTPVGTASNGTMTGWTIGEIAFDETNRVIRYNFTFTNYSEFAVNATITNYTELNEALNSFGADISSTETSSNGVINVPAFADNAPGSANYTITLTLNNFSTSLSQSLPINFSFAKGDAPQQAIKEYFTYSSDYTAITGLSDTYLDLEIKPETLVIPNTAPNGTPITNISGGVSGVITTSAFSSPITRAPDTPDPIATFEGLQSKEVIIQNGITYIGSYAFYNCKNLEYISMPSVTKIDFFAFWSCTSLTTVNMPNVTEILYSAFENCTSLVLERLPNVSSISNSVFNGCESLTSITLPSSVTSIGANAFWGTLLTTVTIEASVPPTLRYDAFNFENINAFYVPAESVDAYKAADTWADCADKIFAIS